MKTNDFRLGNSVFYQISRYKATGKKLDKNYTTIEAADDPTIVLTVPTRDLIPIKLTAELLLSMGFVEEYIGSTNVPRYAYTDKYSPDIVFILDAHDDEFDEFTVFIRPFIGDELCLCYIRYYHQFENLFYMINGLELGEKPKKP